ncbi:MAG: exodeoxyribonuclease V subunit gamma [Clostridia bacterium]|nr:exodeoxyribonuclease V subunit gamma [Clostridia bacterium]
MIKLIYGLPGTGKTTEISNQIKKSLDGKKKLLLIVPEQQTVEVERKMLKLLPPSVQLKFEVVNFSRLANKVFRKYGGLSYNYITTGMKNLFMKRTLLKLAPSLSEYQLRVRGDSSLPSLMLSQIDEFKANSINAEKLTLASKELKTKLTEKKLDNGSSLIAKLDDFGKIYAAYDEMVEKSYNDSANDLEELYKNTLKENNFFEGYDVYIDSFSSFTAAEHKIIEKIFEQADNTVISLPYTDTDPVPLHLKSVYETSVKLISASKKPPETLVLNTPFRASSPSLKMLWENLWNFAVTVKEDQKQKASDDSKKDAPPKLPADESIAIIECTDKYSESEAVTNIILKLLENGYRRKEIAVIAGNMENYRGILDSTLEKANIPYFMSEKSSLLTSPLVSMMLSAFAIKQRNWRTDDVIAYLKSGLTDVDQNDIDIFEIYVSTWKIRGKRFLEDFWTMNPDGYSSKISERGLSILQTANEVKNKITLPLCEFFTRLDAAKNVADLCDATFEFFKKLNLSEKLLNCAKKAFFDNDKKSALEIAGSHKAFIKVLSDISATLGNQDMSVEEFASSLKLVLGNTDVGTIPTGADSIILGSASTLRASDIRCAILIGMCEGDFPASTSDCGFFSDNEKQKLKELKEKIDLSSDTKTQNSEELLYAYRAITLPSEKLFMLYNTGSGDNGAKKPSIAISRVLALLPDVKKVNYRLVEESDKLMSKALAFEALGRLTSDDNRDALYKIFESDPKYSDVMKKTSTPISVSDCYIYENLAKSTF